MLLNLHLSVGLIYAELGDPLAILSVELTNESSEEIVLQDVGFEIEGQLSSVVDVCDEVFWSALLDFPPPLTIYPGERRAFGLSLQLLEDFLELSTDPLTFRAWADSTGNMGRPTRVWSELWVVEKAQRLFLDPQSGLWLRPLRIDAAHLLSGHA